MKEIVYLAGQISASYKGTYQGRKEVTEHLKKNNGKFEIIDPCSNLYNKELLDRQISNIEIHKNQQNSLLVSKDKSFIERSTICIADMNMYDPDKPLIGTLFELAWYHSCPSKTVIGIYNKNYPEYYSHHAFIREAVTTWVNNHIDACGLIQYYFL